MAQVPPQKQQAGTKPAVDETVHHESHTKRVPPKGIRDLNLTSMLDVCFQLLIFFILTASFAKGEGFLAADLPLGQGTPNKDTPEQPININVLVEGNTGFRLTTNISRAQRPASVRALFRELKSRRGSTYDHDNPIIIKPDGQVRWDHVVNVYNACVRAKYSNINFSEAN